MKFLKFLTETEMSRHGITNLLITECDPFLKEIKKHGNFLFRGSSNTIDDIKKVIPRIERKPSDTPKKIHDMANRFFIRKFGWDGRNGVFATGSSTEARLYGNYTPYLFFPINKYKFIWSPEVNDFWKDLVDTTEYYHGENQSKRDNIEIKLTTYIDTDLSKAILSNKEIMFKCEAYYLINQYYYNDIQEELFK